MHDRHGKCRFEAEDICELRQSLSEEYIGIGLNEDLDIQKHDLRELLIRVDGMQPLSIYSRARDEAYKSSGYRGVNSTRVAAIWRLSGRGR
jgi:hypothetical protein